MIGSKVFSNFPNERMQIIQKLNGEKLIQKLELMSPHGNKINNLFHEIKLINAKKYVIRRTQYIKKHLRGIFDIVIKF